MHPIKSILFLTILGCFFSVANAQLTESDVFSTDSLLAHTYLIAPNVHAENVHSSTMGSVLTWDAASGLFDGRVISYSFTHRVHVDTAEAINSMEFSEYRLFDLELFDELSVYRAAVEEWLTEVGLPVYAHKAAAIPLRIFPNPATSRVFIQSDQPFGSEFTITIYDVNGNRIEQWLGVNKGGHQNISLNVSNYPKGTYLLTITGNKTRLIGKFVKQ